MPHEDNDVIAKRLLAQCLNVIKSYHDYILENPNKDDINIFHHIRKRFYRKGLFPIYTTCGYKIFKAKDDKLKYYAYFLYIDHCLGINLTSQDSMYHTFDASFGKHLTSVPVCCDKKYVYFNHLSFFIFAWGNGKSARRLWLEERGYQIQSNHVNRSDFERYFNRFSQDEQEHVIQECWI